APEPPSPEPPAAPAGFAPPGPPAPGVPPQAPTISPAAPSSGGPDSGRLSRADRRRAAEVTEVYPAPIAPAERPDPQPAGWAPPPPDFGQGQQRPLSPMPPRPEQDEAAGPPARGRGGLPAWSARKRGQERQAPAGPPPPGEAGPDSGALPTQAWNLAGQDQQLLSGQTVAGDLLREGAERADAARRTGREQQRPIMGPPAPGFAGPPGRDGFGGEEYGGDGFGGEGYGRDGFGH